MKRLSQSLSLYLCIGLCAGLFTFTGCTSDSLTGADLQRYETNDTGNGNGNGGSGGGTQWSDPHNEGNKSNDGSGGGTQWSDPHNEG